MEYFTQLSKSSNPNSYEPAFVSFTPKVSEAMNSNLTRRVSKDEVREAVFSINADSASGPDGMTGAFFRSIGKLLVIKYRKKSRKSLT